jgi:hypothetical protein
MVDLRKEKPRKEEMRREREQRHTVKFGEGKR